MAKTKILIAEDEAITANDLQDRLKDLGYDAPAIASSGEEAIKMAEGLKPDLVLMDIGLNGMDGIEAAVHIHDRFDIPVIYLTAYIDEERLERTNDTEPLGYIIKPFKANELRPAIEMALRRHKLEKTLRDSEKFSASLLNNSPNPILVINPDTSVRYVNPALERLTGFSSAELIGCKAPYPWWTEETVQKTHNDLEKAMREGAQKLEELFQKRNGGRFRVEITSAPIMSDGEFKYYLANWMDITERKQAEEALRESEERYRTLFNSSNDAVIVHRPTTRDMPGKIIEVNEIACQKFGYTREELLKLSHLDLIASEDLEDLPKLKEKLLTVDHIIFEITAVTKDSNKFPCEISTHLFEFQGQPTVLSIVRDISERKKSEEELKKKNEKLKRFNKLAVGRELRMVELKKEINALLEQLGEENRY